jgi:hypothetical protein
MTDSSTPSPVPRTRLFATLLGAAAAAAATLSLASPAGAVTLGSTHVAQPSQAAFFCGGFETCAYAQTRLLDGTVKAPFNGTIRTWKVNDDGGPGPFQLLVLSRRSDGSFKAVAASTPRPAIDGVNTYGARLEIRKGDYIGLNILDDSTFIQSLNPRMDRSLGFVPAFDLGMSQRSHKPFNSPFDELQFNAQLRH